MPGVEVINICKGPHVFGLSVNIVDSGTLTVTSVTPGSACQRDGRLKPGDVLISVNGRCLVNAEAKTVGEALRSVDKSASDVVIHYLPALSSSLSTLDSLSILRRPSTKSEEYFDVPETEPPDPPINCPPPLPSEVDTPPPTYTPLEPKVLPPAESKLSPISLPAITSPKPSLGLKPLDVGSMVSKMKPTVPFKPTRVSLSPKDALPARVKSKLSLIETVLTGDRGTATRQWGPESTVELERDPVKGLGISILHANKVDNVRGGIFIKNVLPDSPAGLEGTLKRGDRILEVNGVDIRNADHAEAVSVIKTATNPVKFIIQSLVPMPKKTEQETPSLTKSPSFSSPESSPKDVLKVTDILPLTSPTLSSPVLKTQESLSRSSSNSSTFETSRTSFGEASKRSSIPSEPAGTVQSQPIVLSVASEPTSNVQSQSPFVQSVQEEEAKEAEDEVPAPLAEGKVYSRKGKQIDLDSAANIKLTPLEVVSDTESEDEFGYTTKKVQKKYGDMKGELILVHMVKGSNKLGLSLAGNKDRTKMSVFVCGMHPKGVAAKDGRIRIGDEVLEVNGVVVYGRCHLNASAMIKSLSGTAYRILLLRRDGAVDEMAVKPLSQFPSELDEEAIEDKYCHYRGMHTVTVRKGALGLGIMIIEGKHAEVGQGIFISDIQENSAAEQAGLNVGDMILAANDADLVGADYDTAATILKQAEGLLTLIVANPNKPTPGYIYEEKKDAEIPEKNMTIKTCEKKKEKRQAPIPPPKPRKSSTGMPQPLETRTLEVSVAPLPAAAVISEVANAALSPQEDSEPDPKKCDIRPARETTIEITKEKIGLGLSIVGGSDTPLGAVIIHEVYPDGAAALDGRLRPGDQILEVNGEDLRDALHEHAIAVLRQTPSVVQLVVYREDEEAAFEAMDVELNKKPGRGLGLSIVGRKNGPGVFISEVVKGGIAEADGRLIQGDQILEVNGQDLKTASQEHAAAVLKTTMGRIHMKIGRLKAGSRRSTTAPKIQENLDSISCSPAELKTIRLERGPSGLGFSIVGGRGSPHGDLPIFVKRVFGGAAEGHLRQGDQIVSVNARPLQGLTHDEAVEVLRRVSGTVALDILS